MESHDLYECAYARGERHDSDSDHIDRHGAIIIRGC